MSHAARAVGPRFALAAVWLAAVLGPALAADEGARLEGTLLDAQGQPVARHRVVARDADGDGVFVSAPTDEDGRWVVVVPGQSRYLIVAVINPSGGRIALEGAPLAPGRGTARRDITLPVPVEPSPRAVREDQGGVDRLFLSFVEDPAEVRQRHLEVAVGGDSADAGDRFSVIGLAAFQPAGLPGVELGVRGAFVDLEDTGSGDDAGPSDLDVWAKLRVFHSATNRTELAAGALITLPTGDDAIGLGHDALQSKLFVGASHVVRTAVLIAHAGVRTTENGEILGVPLEGRISPSAGLGVVVPFVAPTVSLVFEVDYEGERFEQTDTRSTALFGVNWRTRPHGKLRAAIAGGLGGEAPDFSVRAGYAFTF